MHRAKNYSSVVVLDLDQCWNRVMGHRVNDFGWVRSGHGSV